LFSSLDLDSIPLFTNFFSDGLSLDSSASESSLLLDKFSAVFAGFFLGASSPVLPFFYA